MYNIIPMMSFVMAINGPVAMAGSILNFSSMTLQDDERTLQDKQIDATMAKIIKNLQTRLGAELR